MLYGAGERLGPYEILGEIGSGSFKTVLRARNVGRAEAPEEVALAIPHRQDLESALRHSSEFELMRHLRHPHIVRVYETRFLEDEGTYFVVMELVEGCGLDELLADGSCLPPDTVARIGAEVASGLAHAHALHVIHRDIKPGNILIGNDGMARVADFGIARLVASTYAQADSLVGTIDYMAPEQFAGATGRQADLWALGVTLYEALTGQHPFRGENSAQTMQRIQTAVPAPPTDLVPDAPPGLCAALLRALERDLARRYASAEEFGETLARMAGADALKLWVAQRGVGLPGRPHRLAPTGAARPRPRSATAIDFGWLRTRLRHAFTGREWLNAEIDGWLHEGGRPAFVIFGEPGVGKSAIVAWLGEQRAEQVAAIHFCTSQDRSTLDPHRFVASTVAQLMRNQDYAELVQAREPDRHRETATQGFLELVVEPVRALPEPPEPALLIIDSLDEAMFREGETILDVLVAQAPELPPWLRVIATSRPNDEVRQRTAGFACYELRPDSAQNLDDLRRYIAQRLEDGPFDHLLAEAGVSAEQVRSNLEHLSEGNFLVARLVLDALAEGDLTPDEIADRVRVPLHDYFQRFFHRHFPDGEQYDEAYYPVLAALSVAVEPLPLGAVPHLLNCSQRMAARHLAHLSSLLEARSGGIMLFHRSLAEWLQDRERSLEYWCEPCESHAMTARALVALRGEGELPASGLRSLPYHLTGARRWDDLVALLSADSYVNALRSSAGVSREDAVRVYSQALASIPVERCHVLWQGPRATWVLALEGLSRLLDQDDLDRAGALLETAREPLAAMADPELDCRWHTIIGRLQFARGHHDEAARLAARAVQRAGAMADHRAARVPRIDALLLIAACHELQGRLGAAEEALGAAEGLTVGCDDEALAGRVLLAAARVSWLRGQTEAAAQRYRAALAIWERLENVTRCTQVLVGLGMCAVQRGDREGARELFERAARRTAAANWARAAAENNLGTLLLEEGRYLEASSHLNAGLVANRLAQDRRGIAQSLASIGELHYRLARLDEAERTLEQSVAEAEAIQDACCLTLAQALLQRVHFFAAGPTGWAGPPAAVADLPREVAAAVRLAALEWQLRREDSAAALAGCLRQAADAARAVAATDPNAAVRNAAVEGLCAVLEAAWAAGEVRLASEAAQQLERHVELAVDAHLGHYARWLASVCHPACGRQAAALVGPKEPHTVFALRAQRLLDARDA